MAMQWWLYKGSVTTPVDVPGKGPTVIKPRMKFQAPPRAVANLKRIGLVVPCKDPNPPKKEAAVSGEPVPAVPKRSVSTQKSAPKASEGGSDGAAPVVASIPSKEAAGEEAGESQEKSREKEEGKSKKTRVQRRRS